MIGPWTSVSLGIAENGRLSSCAHIGHVLIGEDRHWDGVLWIVERRPGTG